MQIIIEYEEEWSIYVRPPFSPGSVRRVRTWYFVASIKDEGKDKKRPRINFMWRFIIIGQDYLKRTLLLSCQAKIYPMDALSSFDVIYAWYYV